MNDELDCERLQGNCFDYPRLTDPVRAAERAAPADRPLNRTGADWRHKARSWRRAWLWGGILLKKVQILTETPVDDLDRP